MLLVNDTKAVLGRNGRFSFMELQGLNFLGDCVIGVRF